jgi:Circularly permutated YpsA SLOG family
MKIISGGQTGVDRAALDVALKNGVECGGWCPAGRLDEFGRIPDRYPLKELREGSFAERTLANVRDSQATVAIYRGDLTGGTKYAIECSRELKKPHLLIDAARISEGEAANLVLDFVRQHKIDIIGIGGPRQSEWPDGYEFASSVIELFLTRSATP